MTEPTAITELRTMLLACASVVTVGIPSGRFYYPDVAITSDAGTTVATKPYAILAESSHTRTPFAGPGVIGLPSGSLAASFHFDPSMTIGAVEGFCRDVCSELMIQMTGLPIRSASAELSSEPTPGALASDATQATTAEIQATVTVEWGLS